MTKLVLPAMALVLLFPPSGAWAGGVKVSPEKAEFLNLLRVYASAPAVARGMWPGFDLSKYPLMICEEGESRCSAAWQKSVPKECYPMLVPGTTAFSSCPNLFGGIKTGFMLHYPYAGADLSVFRFPAGADKWEKISTITHELFHLYQTGFVPLKDGGGVLPADIPAEALAIAFMEDMYLATGASVDKDDHYRRFVAMRRLLMAKYPEIGRATNDQETLEGTARYIEDASSGDHSGEGVRRSWILDYLTGVTAGAVPEDSAFNIMSDRLYYTGAQQCIIMMDRLERMPDWRQRVEKGESVFSLFSGLVGAPKETPEQTAAALASDSSYLAVLKIANAVVEKSSSAVRARMEEFRSSKDVRLSVSFPQNDGEHAYSGYAWNITDGFRLIETSGANFKTKYYDLSLSSTAYTFDARGGDAASVEALVGGSDGLELILDDAIQSPIPAKAAFSSIELAGKKAVLRGGPGKLSFSGGVLSVSFDGRDYP